MPMARRKNPFVPYLLLWAFFVVVSFVLAELFLPLVTPLNGAIALTVGTFLLFGLDKFQAGHRHVRVPEKLFYLTVALGGSVGALFGMYMFRHKTRKTEFQFVIILLILLQLAIFYFIFQDDLAVVI